MFLYFAFILNTFYNYYNAYQQTQKFCMQCPQQCKLHPECEQPLCAGRWTEDLSWQRCWCSPLFGHTVCGGCQCMVQAVIALQNHSYPCLRWFFNENIHFIKVIILLIQFLQCRGGMLQQLSLLAAGAQPWHHNICTAHSRRFAYAATLAIYVYEVR